MLLAAQTLSKSVADAIEFCTQEGIEGFEGNEATVWFIRTVNRVFDIFNSRNIFGHDFKGPLTPENAEHFFNTLDRDLSYLSGLELESRTFIH